VSVPPTRHAAAVAGALASAALLGYVAYAHVAAYRARRHPELTPFAIDLGAPGAVGRDVVVEPRGGAVARADDGALSARGPAGAEVSVARAGDDSPLADALYSVRFRRDPHAGAVSLVLRTATDRELALRLEGDHLVLAGAANAAGAPSPVVAIGRPLDGAAEPSWHDLALRVSPQIGAALGSLDGQPGVSSPIDWATATPVRASVRAAGEGDAPLAVDLSTMSCELVPPRRELAPFIERFQGKVIDPLRWATLLPDPQRVVTESRVLASGGLWIDARSTRATDVTSGLTLVTPRQELRSFRLSARVQLRALHAAAVFVGVGTMDAAFVARRSFEAGLLDLGGTIAPFAGGHWLGTDQRSFEPLPLAPRAPSDASAYRVELAYDASTSVGTVTVDGAKAFDRKVDLRALDDVTLRFGVNVHEVGAHAEVVVDEVRLDVAH
jgi:hypothetical protein